MILFCYFLLVVILYFATNLECFYLARLCTAVCLIMTRAHCTIHNKLYKCVLCLKEEKKNIYFNLLKLAERLRASGGSSQSERNKDSNPFTHSGHGNPAFTPQKVSKGSNLVSKRIEEWLIPND